MLLKQPGSLSQNGFRKRNIDGIQLPSAVTRTSLLYAHPEDGKPVTVVSTQGDLLLKYQQKWLGLLGEWYEVHGDQVANEQGIYDEQLNLSF